MLHAGADIDAPRPKTLDDGRHVVRSQSAGQDEANPPAPPKVEPYKTHLAYVKERRSDADGKAILEEALSTLRDRKLIQ